MTDRTYARLDQKGFSIPELLTVISVTTLFTALVLFFGINYWRYGYLQEADLSTLVSRLNAQDFLREQIGSSSGLVIQNGIPDPNASAPDATIPGGNYWTPVHAVPTVYATGGTGTTPLMYYKRLSTDSSGAFIMNGTQPYEDEYILFLDNASKELRVRSIANPSATGNRVKTSCPASLATAACPVDKVIAKDLASVSMRFFSRSGNPIDWTSLFDPTLNTYIGPDYPSVEVAEFTLKIAVKPIFQKTQATKNTTVIRIALRNT